MANNIIINGAKIFFKNFAGKESQYNAEGNRNFCVKIDNDLAEKLEADGWKVKYTKPRDEEDIPEPYLQINVSYRRKAPKIVCIEGNRRQEFDESRVDMLDWMDLSNTDLRINGSHWEFAGKTGIKGYLDAMYITLEEDELDKKYSYLNDAPPTEEEAAPWN